VALGLMFALRVIVLNTKVGMAMRALSFNPTACALMGVNTDVIISFTFGLGSALAAAAGILFGLMYPSIDPLMGILIGLKAFVAAVLGGIGNIPGAALGGLLIGVIETMVVGYGEYIGISSSYRDGVAFAILILILLVKPSGLLGKAATEKV
jgi:branched-chain amino acid transport system permease protein